MSTALDKKITQLNDIPPTKDDLIVLARGTGNLQANLAEATQAGASAGLKVGGVLTATGLDVSGPVDFGPLSASEIHCDGPLTAAGPISATQIDCAGPVTGLSFSGDGSGLTGIGTGTGGLINTGSTTIGADSDADAVGIIDLQTRGATRLRIENAGGVTFFKEIKNLSAAPLNNNFGYESGNSYQLVAFSAGISGMAAATGVPLANFQIHSRPNAAAGKTDFNYGIFGYRHGTNGASDGNSWATVNFVSAIESDSTAIPQASLYHDIVGAQFIATAKAGSKAAAFGLNSSAFMETSTGFANGGEFDIYNYSGAPAVSLTAGATYGQTHGLSIVSGIGGAGSLYNSGAIEIAVSGGFNAAFLTGIFFGASSTKDYGIDMINVGTGSSTAIPIRLGNNTFINSRNGAGTLDKALIGLNAADGVLVGNPSSAMLIQGTAVTIGAVGGGGLLNVHGGRSFFGANSEAPNIGLGYSTARAQAAQTFYLGASDSATPDLIFANVGGSEKARLTNVGNLKIGGSAVRATEGTNHLDLFNGTAPAGALTNGVSIYSGAGELRVIDAAGNDSLLSPHDKIDNSWIFHSVNTVTGKALRIDIEKLCRFLDQYFGTRFVQEYEVTK